MALLEAADRQWGGTGSFEEAVGVRLVGAASFGYIIVEELRWW